MRTMSGTWLAQRVVMTNTTIALTFERVATLLEEQGASVHRVRAWRDGASAIREYPRDVRDVFRDHGRVGLEAIPHIGPKLANVLIEIITSGQCSVLDRLRGDSIRMLERLPGLGPCLAQRVQRELGVSTLEELETVLRDGRLAELPGFGPRRVAMLRDILEARLHPTRSRTSAQPPVELLLAIDREYRAAAAANRLPTIAPRRFNPHGMSWLPVMHIDRDGWHFTAMFSNTGLAHQLRRTQDWVVVYFHDHAGPDARATVVTEWRGELVGRRVVRGREAECEKLYGLEEHRAAS
ncbi:MAG: helix-hairpin-helix domain-containing protein [Kofleriaceae bacterium]